MLFIILLNKVEVIYVFTFSLFVFLLSTSESEKNELLLELLVVISDNLISSISLDV